jgi:peptidoglycan/LPS O-acetylase OafA/YrhL
MNASAPAVLVATKVEPSPFQISPFQSDLLDLARWVAAFLVVIEHLRSFMFTDYGAGDRMNLLGKAFYFMTGFGHSAVMIFFVMSGFLVGGKVLERLSQGTFSWLKYAVDRSSRLYAVYVLALLLGGGLDYFGCHYLNRFGLYDESFSGRIPVVNFNFHQNLSPSIFGLNLIMCQTILGPVFGSNGPLWSLANEAWYYLAGPLLFALLYRRRWRSVTFSLVVLAALIWFLPVDILVYSLVWLMGAGLYLINHRRYLPLWCPLLLFAVSFSLARLQCLMVPYLADFLIGVSFALLINSATGSAQRLPWHSLSRRAANFSYSVYLCHFPFLVFVLSALYVTIGVGLRGQRTVLSSGLFLLILVMVYGWCYGVSLFTERQTPRIREWLKRRLGLDPPFKTA